MNQVLSGLASRLFLDAARPLVDSRIAASGRPFDGGEPFRPYPSSRLWSVVHYGVFVPRLPDPYRYVNTMTFIGPTGTEAFDNDGLVDSDARNLATVLSSTASIDHHHYAAYDSGADCDFAADGSILRWGDDLTLTVDGERVHVTGRYETFDVDLDLRLTDQVSYFVRTPVYQHLSLLAPYTGTIRDSTGSTAVSGLGTFEYARAMGHQAGSPRALPNALKLPVDLFTYQVIQLDDRTQLLLTDVQARGRTACRLLHVRVLGEETSVYEDVTFEVTAWDRPQTDQWGRTMRVPQRMRWTVRDGATVVFRIDATVDSPLRFGHGRGYVAAYSYDGTFRGASVAGSGYMEWVDTRSIGNR
ncbi:hypothetical protein JVX90_03030 [Gordonia sp. PDNC005]|uniref:DUF6670 family protein n=1 Tax=unclassified Gordonia (in: high G+C Gram-positive bacteria) TaxID=2657482 RepID=UPI0019668C06|nr:DUF6670 family protein [Gordonia sp. PDNC005]QRY63233.1 hypothetical protein JVX90_03030 [Gordonia sp. PDNC005]